MKKLFALMLIVALVFCGTTAFAQAKTQGGGDGGFFTKFFNGLLRDAWVEGSSGTQKATKSTTKETSETIKKQGNWLQNI